MYAYRAFLIWNNRISVLISEYFFKSFQVYHYYTVVLNVGQNASPDSWRRFFL